MRTLRQSLFVALALVSVSAVHARAQAPTAFNGVFTLNAQQSDNIDQAINQTVSRMNIATRQIARPRLRRTNQPYQRITFANTASQISITTDQRAAIVTPVTGAPIRWTREDNDVLDVSTTLEGGRLKQVFAAEDGRRENVYSLSADGRTLTMNVTVTSPRLPQPLRYKVVYDRAS